MPLYHQAASDFLHAHPALQRFRVGRLWRVIIKMIFTAAAIAGITVFLYRQTPHLAILIVGAILDLAAVYRVGMPHRHFPKMVATVEKTEHISKRVKRPDSVRGMMDAVVLLVTICTSRGKNRKIEVPAHYDGVWQVGDTLLQIPGIPHLLTPDPHSKVVCPYCGSVMPRSNDYCVECRQINIYDDTPNTSI